ncbi:MAG: hypothetical protein SH868_14710, partial [Bythopirellula sp.]|nr:hypothetical protein [Bythopirellula sp.]
LVPPIKGKWFFPEGIFWAEEPPCFSTTRGTFSAVATPEDEMFDQKNEMAFTENLTLYRNLKSRLTFLVKLVTELERATKQPVREAP